MDAPDTFRRRSGQAGCIALAVLGLCVLAGPRQAESQGNGKGLPPGPDVRVINTPANPVPVVGAVQVTSLPGTLFVRPPADDPGAAFAVRLTGSVDSPINTVNLSQEIPAGKMLVIETVTVSASLPAGQKVTARILTSNSDGDLLIYNLAGMTLQGAFLGNADPTHTATHHLRARAWPSTGSDVVVQVLRDVTAGRLLANATLSGYLIDL
jgi:hypothetical protein